MEKEEEGGKECICAKMFEAAFFIMATHWKQPKRPCPRDWINKLRDSHPTGHYWAIQGKAANTHKHRVKVERGSQLQTKNTLCHPREVPEPATSPAS